MKFALFSANCPTGHKQVYVKKSWIYERAIDYLYGNKKVLSNCFIIVKIRFKKEYFYILVIYY